MTSAMSDEPKSRSPSPPAIRPASGRRSALKTALDPAVRAASNPIVLCDPRVLKRHAELCWHQGRFPRGIGRGRRELVGQPRQRAGLHPRGRLCLGRFGVVSAPAGRASIAFCGAAIKAAMAGEVDAVVAAPQNETSIARPASTSTGIPRSWRARPAPTESVFMMLCFGETRSRTRHCTGACGRRSS